MVANSNVETANRYAAPCRSPTISAKRNSPACSLCKKPTPDCTGGTRKKTLMENGDILTKVCLTCLKCKKTYPTCPDGRNHKGKSLFNALCASEKVPIPPSHSRAAPTIMPHVPDPFPTGQLMAPFQQAPSFSPQSPYPYIGVINPFLINTRQHPQHGVSPFFMMAPQQYLYHASPQHGASVRATLNSELENNGSISGQSRTSFSSSDSRNN